MIKNLIGNILKQFGYKISKTSNQATTSQVVQVIENKENLVGTFYNNLKAANFYPKHVVDIGANTGTWTRELLKNFPDTSVLMIEPQERLKPQFEDLLNEKIIYAPLGVSNKNDILRFTFHERDDSCSFVYTAEEAKTMGLEQTEIPVKTLNTIIKENNYPCPDVIKIDAEGLDLEVIEGASDFYGKTEVFLVEATVCCTTYNNTTAKVVKAMDEAGYQIYEITDLNRPFPQSPVLWLIEIAFVKKDGFLLQQIKI